MLFADTLPYGEPVQSERAAVLTADLGPRERVIRAQLRIIEQAGLVLAALGAGRSARATLETALAAGAANTPLDLATKETP